MRWRAWSVAALVGTAGACAVEPGPPSRAPVLPGASSPVRQSPPASEETVDEALDTWRATVLDRADADTLALIRRDLEARIRRLQDRDVQLSYLPPGIAVEERSRLASRLALERRRLDLLNGADSR